MAKESWKVPDAISFEVKYHKKATSTSVFLDADLLNFKIKIYRKRIFEHDKKARSIDAGLIYQIAKAVDNDRLLLIHWRADKSVNKKGKEKVEKYTFRNAEERQKFYEAATYCRYKGKQTADATEDITVFVGSWNMGNTPPPASLDAWIPKNKHVIYFIGLQESSYTHPKEYKNCEEHLVVVFKQHMGNNYVLIEVLSLSEIRFLLFAHRDHAHKITNIEKGTEATGVAHVVGNKGAVGVAFHYHETALCFINSHLAAHQEHVEARNQNYYEIVEELHLGNGAFDLTNHFSHVFWTGDLNYRIDLERSKCMELIGKKDWESLRAADQLINQRDKLNKAFRGWSEAQLSFPPTYRYTRGTKTYNDELGRIPAWCDRVMWKSLPELAITQHEYNCSDDIQTSDHHPIYCTFTLATKLPNVPHEPKIATIRVTDLRGANLVSKDSNGFSDPYVVFTGPILGEEKRTVIIEKTLDPVYNDEDVPELRPCVANRSYMATQHLFMIVRDYDHTSKDDEMGQCVVSLKNACGSRPVAFKVSVSLNGVYWGTLEGKVHVVWGEGRKKGRMDGLTGLLDRVKHLDDGQAKDLLMHFAQQGPDPRAALLALLNTDSVAFGPSILREIDEVAPAAKITPRGSVSKGSSLSGSASRKDTKDKKEERDRKESKKEIVKKP